MAGTRNSVYNVGREKRFGVVDFGHREPCHLQHTWDFVPRMQRYLFIQHVLQETTKRRKRKLVFSSVSLSAERPLFFFFFLLHP